MEQRRLLTSRPTSHMTSRQTPSITLLYYLSASLLALHVLMTPPPAAAAAATTSSLRHSEELRNGGKFGSSVNASDVTATTSDEEVLHEHIDFTTSHLLSSVGEVLHRQGNGQLDDVQNNTTSFPSSYTEEEEEVLHGSERFEDSEKKHEVASSSTVPDVTSSTSSDGLVTSTEEVLHVTQSDEKTNGSDVTSSASFDEVHRGGKITAGSDVTSSRSGSTSSSPVNELRIAVILPQNKDRMFSVDKLLPAIQTAIDGEAVARRLLPDRHFTVLFADSRCSQVHGPLAAIDFCIKDKVHAFFGPVCDYSLAPVARYSPHWNTPVLSAGGFAHDFGADKKAVDAEFPLLTRIGVTFDSMARGLQSVLQNYGWHTIKLAFESEAQSAVASKLCYLAASAVIKQLDSTQGLPVDYYRLDLKQRPRDVLRVFLLDEIGSKYAIVVLCASADTVRDILIEAAERHFDNGEYVFVNIDLFASKSSLARPWYRPNDTEARNAAARRAYESVLTVTLSRPDSPEYRQFTDTVRQTARNSYGYDVYAQEEEVNSFVGAFHDAVLLYALAVNETLDAGIDPSNGSEVTKRMWNRTFQGITGTVSIDANGDRNGDYTLLDLDPESGQFQPVANYFGARRRYEPVEGRVIHWGAGRTSPPPDVPRCGFDGKRCLVEDLMPDYAIVIIVFGSVLIVVAIAALFAYRHYRMEAELQAEENWRVRWDDIRFGDSSDGGGVGGERGRKQHLMERNGSRYSRRVSVHSNVSADTIICHLGDVSGKQVFTKTASYKSSLVAVKHVEQSFAVNKQLLLELKKVRDLQNDHVVRFLGLCIDVPHQCLLTEYCQKGSLQDVLENEQIKLDNVFKFSLIQDLVRAMSYLHGTDIRSHGNLKSTNCVVDGRFVLKVTDFGLHSLRSRCDHPTENDNVYAYYRAKLWTAPELLRLPCRPPEGTQKGDVYSFAIICQEIVHRRGPFWVHNMDHLSPKEIYMYVKEGQLSPAFRPTILDVRHDSYGCSEELAALVRRCWAEDPIERPDFNNVKGTLKRINSKTEGSASGNLLDNLLSRMEQYAYNLEALVDERTADYLEQKKRAEDLLYMMLPRSVAVQLMRGETVQAEKFESVTIYFSDICGFTSLSAVSSPLQVVDLLNDLYTTFDSIIDQFDVYKVETIGDAYMVVSGLPIPNGFLHAREIGRMALRLLKEVKSFRIRHRPGDKLLLRIGIHSGPVCAGVVGHKMPRYCLFGDTVNTASRMESNGEAWKIHVSPQTKEILDVFGSFKLDHRGLVAMKGKGEIDTWWLMGEENPDFPDLAPQSKPEV